MPLIVSLRMRRNLHSLQDQLFGRREQLGVSRDELAERLGKSKRTVFDWERCYDQPSLENGFSWARELGLHFALEDRLDQLFQMQPYLLDESDGWQTREFAAMAPMLKYRRVNRRISQTDVGRTVGISRSSWQRWEDGEQLPRMIALMVAADRLDFDLRLREIEAPAHVWMEALGSGSVESLKNSDELSSEELRRISASRHPLNGRLVSDEDRHELRSAYASVPKYGRTRGIRSASIEAQVLIAMISVLAENQHTNAVIADVLGFRAETIGEWLRDSQFNVARLRPTAPQQPDSSLPMIAAAEAQLETFIATLRQDRRDSGVTQREIARYLRVSLKTVFMWETAGTSLHTPLLFGWAYRLGREFVVVAKDGRPVRFHDDHELTDNRSLADWQRTMLLLRDVRTSDPYQTQLEVACAAGVSPVSLRKWEELVLAPRAVSFIALVTALECRLILRARA